MAAGAFVTAALSLALLALGTGIGFSSVSPWANGGASASAVGWTAIAWLVLMQIIAASVGGYVAGRLRTRWVHVHTHEVYFRDTAHGFLVWAVGLVISAAFLTSAATSMIGASARANAMTSDTVAAAPSRDGLAASGYVVDTLLRTNTAAPEAERVAMRNEIALIFANGLREGSLPSADRTYLGHIVATRTGVTQADADRRVDDAFVEAQQRADDARKAIAHAMYWTFVALLIGAFCASVAATFGGRERDRVVVI